MFSFVHSFFFFKKTMCFKMERQRPNEAKNVYLIVKSILLATSRPVKRHKNILGAEKKERINFFWIQLSILTCIFIFRTFEILSGNIYFYIYIYIHTFDCRVQKKLFIQKFKKLWKIRVFFHSNKKDLKKYTKKKSKKDSRKRFLEITQFYRN